MVIERDAHLYVIGLSDGPQKVGIAYNPLQRLSNLQVSSAGELKAAITICLPRTIAIEVERYAHWLLKDRHIRGEWFNVTPAEAVKAARAARSAVQRGERVPRRIRGNGTVGRKKINSEQTPARFPKGTLARIDAVLADREKRSDLLREAVEREIVRRERLAAAKRKRRAKQ